MALWPIYGHLAPGSNLSQVTTGKQCKSSALALRQRVFSSAGIDLFSCFLIIEWKHLQGSRHYHISGLHHIVQVVRDLFVSFFMSLQSDHFASFNISASAASLQKWVKTVQIFICPCVLKLAATKQGMLWTLCPGKPSSDSCAMQDNAWHILV